MAVSWEGFEAPSGVDVDHIPFDMLREGDVIDARTEAADYHCMVTSTGSGRSPLLVGYIRFRHDAGDDTNFGWEPLLYQVELRGGCRVGDKPLTREDGTTEHMKIPYNIVPALALQKSIFMVDRSGLGAIHLTAPVTALSWYATPSTVEED